jgi:hypothetical protein
MTARAKMNAAIVEANKVVGKVEQSALTAEAQARQQGLAAEAQARQQGLAAEAQARQQGLAARDSAIAERLSQAEHLAATGRLGEAPRAATADLDGAPASTEPIAADRLSVSATAGAVLSVVGAASVAPRAVQRLEPGRRYRLRVVIQRVSDTSDPAGDTVRIGLRWLRADKSGLSTTILSDLVGVSVASGRLEYVYAVATIDDDVDAVAPTGAVYARPFVRFYGDGEAQVEVMAWEDLSLATEWSPDVSEFRRSLAGVDHRLGDAEQEIATLAEALAIEQQAAARASYALVETDGDFTISAVSDARLIRHTATLTQTRQAALIVPGAEVGATVRLVRSGVGPFPLNVGPGLKAVAAGSWADFTFDGAAWFVAAAGTL